MPLLYSYAIVIFLCHCCILFVSQLLSGIKSTNLLKRHGPAQSEAIRKGERPKLDCLKTETLKFLEQCWDSDPEKRFSFEQIVEYLMKYMNSCKVYKFFFENVDYDDINEYISTFNI
ncbi:hypothetical protein TRFO_05192 [Tritrichomonas foetus]|uniref:Serine-threonine/tyrosine-protein kinase catalytic domain-containing protein n=1 Tax=Tritrichomonas foetus TaxID=1144522 RepID=A0A1J4KDM2_9EUKA|nr:hypothetical protein TRFO_05192 [Tritrichomonas foetus]|eukprot:OHT07557.1 hypothetical protein TRFO_05192 [Tritrichomonas foetus]